MVAGKEIILGVCGGIAAYKVPELVRVLKTDNAQVTCILTANAARFVTPLTLRTLSANRVYEDMFDPFVWEVEHVSIAQKAALIVIIPATADTMARLAQGRADDLLGGVVLAASCPVLLCPAMNDRMWQHPATQRNIRQLTDYGYLIVPPETGELACGTVGTGRLASLDAIRSAIHNVFV